ncbi:glucan biosynthesis protein [Pannonibacter sp. Pt2-lr]
MRQKAREAYQESAAELPERFATLDYDQYRAIRFRPDKAVWRDAGVNYEMQAFPRVASTASPFRSMRLMGRTCVSCISQARISNTASRSMQLTSRAGSAGCGWFPAALSFEPAGVQGRADRLPWLELFPGAWQRLHLRPVRTRAGH